MNSVNQRYRGVTNEPISPDSGTAQPFVRNPWTPASARSKDRLIGGKGVIFPGPRKFMAVVILFGVAALGYGVIVGLHALYKNIDETGKRRADQKNKDLNAHLDPGAKMPTKGTVLPQAPAPGAGEERTEAGTRQRIGVTEVCIVGALRVAPGLAGPGGLAITLRITNYDAKPITYYKRQLTLRDRGVPPKDHPLLEPPAENPKLTGKQTIKDVLWFGPTSMMSILDLDLPASGSDEKFHFFIPTHFIKAGM